MLLTAPNNWKPQAQEYLITGEYSQAASLYEQAIEVEPEVRSHYWHLGLIFLLQEQEAEAQMTWLMAMSEVDESETDIATAELVTVLETEANRREKLEDYEIAWAICQHIREIDPVNFSNILQIVKLSSHLGILAEEEATFKQILQLFNSNNSIDFSPERLLPLLETLLTNNPLESQTYLLAKKCVSFVRNADKYAQALKKILVGYTTQFKKIKLPPKTTIKFTKLCLLIDPNNLHLLSQLSQLYYTVYDYLEGAKVAQKYLDKAQIKEEEITGRYLIIRCLMRAGGHWQEAEQLYQQLETDLEQLIESKSDLHELHMVPLINTVVFANYFRDKPKKNHQFRNRVAKYCQTSLHNYYQQENKPLPTPKSNFSTKNITRPLRIGYVSSCLRRHSVGWLTRWLFKYHNRQRFETYAYFVERTYDTVQEFIVENASHTKDLSNTETFWHAAQLIAEDDLDILIELDSVTSIGTMGIMALKPAPVQVTWLGSDASGLPTVDYFIADDYVLPESAQEYYGAKIWRLPNSYIAVDGFEVDVPSLKREDLGIEDDAVIYMSAQVGYKRHPEMARLQMQIIKSVPNSYFLIKGLSDQKSIQNFFLEIAEQEGVDCRRLKFLGGVPAEATHRANFGIADVILDTYPYNGATTTLETLWMGIPLVTKVGEQFSARNSYTMMINAGITEGIAENNQEYLEWGIRLGKDAQLRQEISWKLKQSRKTAPLWNAKKFTQEMEKAYEKMWLKYLIQVQQQLVLR